MLKKLGRRMRCTSTRWVISASSRWHMRCHLVVKRWLPRWCLDHLNFPSIHGRRVFQIDLWFDACVPNWPLVWCVRPFFFVSHPQFLHWPCKIQNQLFNYLFLHIWFLLFWLYIFLNDIWNLIFFNFIPI